MNIHEAERGVVSSMGVTEKPESNKSTQMKELVSEHFDSYLAYLRDSVKIPSVFIDPEGTRRVLDYCSEVLEKNLAGYKVYFDGGNNLIAIPNDLNPDEDILYLSAHADTVDANPSEWDEPFQPFKPHEDDEQIVARGVNDCKAGVAFELFLASLSGKGLIHLRNTIFTFTFKEEGSGEKTAVEIGKELGKLLPLSSKSTYLVVLENNVRVGEVPTLCIYAAERSGYAIRIRGEISELRELVERLDHWNPVAIAPEDFHEDEHNIDWVVKEQQGGHVASVEREENLLTEVLLSANDNDAIRAGDIGNHSVVPPQILSTRVTSPVKHTLILSNRSSDSLNDVRGQLNGIDYEEVKDFRTSPGFDEKERLEEDKIYKVLKAVVDDSINTEFTVNPGRSDASTIYWTLDEAARGRIIPIIMGPGSRSQRSKKPARLTHGRNETFDKNSGKQAVEYISQVLTNMGFIESLDEKV